MDKGASGAGSTAGAGRGASAPAVPEQGHTVCDRLPCTLAGASEYISRHYPGRNATAAKMADYYELAAKVYRHVADVDPAHLHEATYLAGEAMYDAKQALRVGE